MLPLGGPEGHKGYGLSFAVETLASLLPGLGFGIDPQGRHNDGCFMLVVDPANFQPLGEFKQLVNDFVAISEGHPACRGIPEVLYPGDSNTGRSRSAAPRASRWKRRPGRR